MKKSVVLLGIALAMTSSVAMAQPAVDIDQLEKEIILDAERVIVLPSPKELDDFVAPMGTNPGDWPTPPGTGGGGDDKEEEEME